MLASQCLVSRGTVFLLCAACSAGDKPLVEQRRAPGRVGMVSTSQARCNWNTHAWQGVVTATEGAP